MTRHAIFLAASLLALLGCPAPAGAASPHELQVGAQEEQRCASAVLVQLAAKLGYHDVEKTDDADAPDHVTGVIAAACKKNPEDPSSLIVALATPGTTETTRNLDVVVFDLKRSRILARHASAFEEDAATRFDAGSLWIDTAHYRLSDKVRAFGVDITGGYAPNCGDGGMGASRTLYVREGSRLRPVLSDLPVSAWRFLVHAQSRCNTDPNLPETPVIAEYRTSLSVATTVTNGFRDLVVNMRSTRDDGKPGPVPPASYKLSYDGKTYPSRAAAAAFDLWVEGRGRAAR